MSGSMAIILAAGKSTRMKSALPKVLHNVCGRPMIEYVIDAARSAGVTRIVAIVGHRAEMVQAELSKHRDIEFALQAEQKGTGHAVMMCQEQLRSHHGPVLVLAGDTPATLHQRIQVAEHTLLPEAIRLFALGKLKVADRQVTILE